MLTALSLRAVSHVLALAVRMTNSKAFAPIVSKTLA